MMPCFNKKKIVKKRFKPTSDDEFTYLFFPSPETLQSLFSPEIYKSFYGEDYNQKKELVTLQNYGTDSRMEVEPIPNPDDQYCKFINSLDLQRKFVQVKIQQWKMNGKFQTFNRKKLTNNKNPKKPGHYAPTNMLKIFCEIFHHHPRLMREWRTEKKKYLKKVDFIEVFQGNQGLWKEFIAFLIEADESLLDKRRLRDTSIEFFLANKQGVIQRFYNLKDELGFIPLNN